MRLQIRFQLRSHKGFSILEVLAVLVILGVILSSSIPGCIDRINRAKYEKMINEMTSIAQASIDFYNAQYPHTWPTSISQLAPKYMYQAVTLNPWGASYVPIFSINFVMVSTTIPPGIVQKNPEGRMLIVTPGTNNDTVSIAFNVPNEGIGMVQYEKKYTYNQ